MTSHAYVTLAALALGLLGTVLGAAALIACGELARRIAEAERERYADRVRLSEMTGRVEAIEQRRAKLYPWPKRAARRQT